jgi:hypothetical protein
MAPDYTRKFAQDGTRAEVSDKNWKGGWVNIVGGVNGIPTAQQFNVFGYVLEEKANDLNGRVASNAANLEDLAGEGRTNETVKAAYDAAMAAGGAVLHSFTLIAASWETDDELPTQTLPIPNMKVSDIIAPGIPDGISADQLKAMYKVMAKATLVLRSQIAGSVKVSCLGTVPTVDVPFAVVNHGGPSR